MGGRWQLFGQGCLLEQKGTEGLKIDQFDELIKY
jgi:hypothetical protein